jgi:hypothetical protein
VQTAGGTQRGIAKLVGGRDGEDDVVRRKLLGYVDEVDGNAGYKLY